MIKGGYYIKARCIQESAISTFPPYVREIWDWILKECNHKEMKSSGRIIKRGECVRSYKDIQDGLKWMVGYRTERYKKWQCEKSMKALTRVGMIVTTKTTRGMLIKVLNYNKYQNPKNYESNNDSVNEATRELQFGDTINKNDKKKEYKYTTKNPKTVDKLGRKLYLEGDLAYQKKNGDWMVIIHTGEHKKYTGNVKKNLIRK